MWIPDYHGGKEAPGGRVLDYHGGKEVFWGGPDYHGGKEGPWGGPLRGAPLCSLIVSCCLI